MKTDKNHGFFRVLVYQLFHHSWYDMPVYWYGRNSLNMKHLDMRMKPCDKAEPLNYKLLRIEAFFICVTRYDHQHAF